MATPQSSTRGIWLVMGIFVLGLMALVGLFLAPRGKLPATQPTPATTAPH